MTDMQDDPYHDMQPTEADIDEMYEHELERRLHELQEEHDTLRTAYDQQSRVLVQHEGSLRTLAGIIYGHGIEGFNPEIEALVSKWHR